MGLIDAFEKGLTDAFEGVRKGLNLIANQPPPPEDVSLDKLEQWLNNLNKQFPKDLDLQGVAFDRSSNISLGLTGDPTDFYVFNPGPLEVSGSGVTVANRNTTTLGELSPHQKAFIEVVDHGLKRKDNSTVLIDLATLAPEDMYFKDRVVDNERKEIAGSSLIEKVAKRVNEIPAEKKVVVRLLCGDDKLSSQTQEDKSWEKLRKRFEDIFWVKPEDTDKIPKQTAYTSWIKHPNATLYVGYYCPDFLISPTDADIASVKFFFNKILHSSLLGLVDSFTGFLKGINADFMVSEIVKRHPPAITWNHGKVLAVNGSTLMTGGINYWNVYAHTGNHNICDTSVKVKGDAAVAAHKWADYFWTYLQNQTPSDKTSLWRSANLSTDTKGQRPTWSDAQAGPVPDSSAFLKQVQAKQSSTLTVARLGDWYGDRMKALRYPVQMIDAVRDMLLQAAWQYFYPTLETEGSSAGLGFITFFGSLTDDFLVSQTSRFQELGINPTAWGSRYLRNQAIAKANSQVVICQQMLVDTLMNGIDSYKEVPKMLNAKIKEMDPKTQRVEWDGSIWPYDILIALAQGLGSIYRSKSKDQPNTMYQKTAKGVYIVLTTNKQHGPEVGWEDITPLKIFFSRLRIIMQNLPTSFGGVPANKVDEVLKTLIHFRRTGLSTDEHTLYTHSKIVCIDRKVMYVGSDNAYPNYNEEHGIWIDDQKTIDTWAEGFFENFWKACVEPDDL